MQAFSSGILSSSAVHYNEGGLPHNARAPFTAKYVLNTQLEQT